MPNNNRDKIIIRQMQWQHINFLFYCLSYIFYGSIITAMGPIIPFLAIETGKPQTYFSFVFFSRAVGYIVGGVIAKSLMERFTLHNILLSSVIVGGISFILSTLNLTALNLILTLFFGSASCIIINIVCNVSIMKIFKQDQGFWIQLLHTIFGVGGFIGPYLASVFGTKSYFVLGCGLALSGLVFPFLNKPDSGDTGRVSEIARPISKSVQFMICILYILYIGQEVGYGSWVSSYATMEGIATQEEAAFASEVFWVTNTVFRIVLLYVTIKVSLRLKYLMIGMIIVGVINLVVSLAGHQWYSAFVGSFFNGMFLASMFALFLDLPSQFGYKLSKSNTANFMMSASLGEGVLAMPIGYAMGIFGAQALYFTQLLFAAISFWLFIRVIGEFEYEEKQNYLTSQKKEIEVSDKLYNV